MNTDIPNFPPNDPEVRITALLLGELPPDEESAVRRAITQDPALAQLHARLRQTIGLVREVAAQPAASVEAQPAGLKLSEDRRQRLLQQFKVIPTPALVAAPRLPGWQLQQWLLPIGLAAVLMILAAISVPNFSRARESASLNSAANNWRRLEGAKEQWALENKKSPNDRVTLEDLKPYLKNNRLPLPVKGERDSLGTVSQPIRVEFADRKNQETFERAVGAEPAAPATMANRYNVSSSRAALPSAPAVEETVAARTLEPDASGSVSGSPSLASPPAALPAPTQAPRSRQSIYLPTSVPGEEMAGADRSAGAVEHYAQVVNGATELALNRSATDGPAGERGRGYVAGNSGGTGAGGSGGAGFGGSTVDKQDSSPVEGPATSPTPGQAGRAGVWADYDNDGKSDLMTLGDQPTLGRLFRPEKRSQQAAAERGVAGGPEVEPRFGDFAKAKDANFDFFAGGVQGGTAPVPAKSAETTSIPEAANEGPRTREALGIELPVLAVTGTRADVPLDTNAVVAEAPAAAFAVPGQTAAAAPKGLSANSSSAPAPVGAISSLNAVGYAAVTPEKVESLQAIARPEAQARAGVAPEEKSVALGFDLAKAEARKRPAVEAGKMALDERLAEDVALAKPAEADGESKIDTLRRAAPAGLASAEGKQVGDDARRLLPRLGNVALGVEVKPRVPGVAEDSTGVYRPASTASVPAPVDGRLPQRAELEREVDYQRQVRDAIKLRVLQESVDSAMPKSSVVEIVDPAEAQPAQKPGLGQRLKEKLTGEVERSARIAVEKDLWDLSPLGFAQPSKQYDPYFFQTESEAIRSKKVLDQVIDKLSLDKAWGEKSGSDRPLKREETLELLRKRVAVESTRGTSLMEIRVKSDKPEEAARIANTVAEVYREERSKPRREIADAVVRTLQSELAEKEKKVAAAEEAVAVAQKEVPPAQSETLAAPLAQEQEKVVARPIAPAPVPQPEVSTAENRFSTFSLNVSDVSFKLAASSLEAGAMPDPGSIRTEEFINAFDYHDPEPAPGVPIAFAWERAHSPFAHNRDLIRFSIQTAARGREAGRPLNLVLLLDSSGSMERADRVSIIREALQVLAGQLKPEDKISVVAFARTARLWIDGLPGSQAGDLVQRVGNLTPEGGTNLEDAMNLAYQTAARHYLANGVNRVVLLTDGAANLGDVDPESLKQKVESNRKQGIALDCFGIGWEGYNDDLLEVLSRNGDGRYGFVNSPEEAATGFANQLAGALQVAASDVKVQVEFNPARVTAYRQIGYAKHQLTQEQFRDNTVDAAEIGAAEAGNALYTLEINPGGEGPVGIVRVRYKVPGTDEYQEHEWEVPYQGEAAALDRSSPAMRLAGTAAALSEWLTSSPFAAEVTPERLLALMGGVPESFGADPRPKKLEWMIRQAQSIRGK
jgi:Mg-chelatase subunit ChlD